MCLSHAFSVYSMTHRGSAEMCFPHTHFKSCVLWTRWNHPSGISMIAPTGWLWAALTQPLSREATEILKIQQPDCCNTHRAKHTLLHISSTPYRHCHLHPINIRASWLEMAIAKILTVLLFLLILLIDLYRIFFICFNGKSKQIGNSISRG